MPEEKLWIKNTIILNNLIKTQKEYFDVHFIEGIVIFLRKSIKMVEIEMPNMRKILITWENSSVFFPLNMKILYQFSRFELHAPRYNSANDRVTPEDLYKANECFWRSKKIKWHLSVGFNNHETYYIRVAYIYK